jgi:OOP family OmpA-OmpF porin
MTRSVLPGFLAANTVNADRPARRAAILFAAAGAVAACAGAWFTASRTVAWVESATWRLLEPALAATGNDWAIVTTDGLKVTLSGEAPDEASRFSAIEAVTALIPAGRLTNLTTVDTAAVIENPDFRLEILRSGPKLSLVGLVPEDGSRRNIDAALRGIAGAAVTDMMDATAAPAPDGWADALAFALDATRMAEHARVSLAPGRVELSAAVPDADVAAALASRLQAEVPDTVALTLDINAPRPVIAPFTFAARLTGGNLAVSDCAAESAEQRDAILAALAAPALAPDACAIGIGAPSPAWPEAIALTLDALRRLGGGDIAIRNADIALTGLTGTDPGRFDSITVELAAALPPEFALTTNLPAPPGTLPDGSAAPPPAFSATWSPDGVIALNGPVRDAMARNAITAFARARFGLSEVTGDMQPHDFLPEGFTPRVLTGLDALSLLHSGELVVDEDSIRLTGVSQIEDIRPQIDALLDARLGPGAAVQVAVSVDPSLRPVTARVAFTQCARQIGQMLEISQIGFQPSESTIAPESLPMLDDIARVLAACPGARFEVGGHTDSQGRDSSNLALSQARADAVVDALVQRGLTTVFLTARGYGETQPIDSNESEEGRARNRRIEFLLMNAPASEDAGDDPGDDPGARDGGTDAGAVDTGAADPGATGTGTTETGATENDIAAGQGAAAEAADAPDAAAAPDLPGQPAEVAAPVLTSDPAPESPLADPAVGAVAGGPAALPQGAAADTLPQAAPAAEAAAGTAATPAEEGTEAGTDGAPAGAPPEDRPEAAAELAAGTAEEGTDEALPEDPPEAPPEDPGPVAATGADDPPASRAGTEWPVGVGASRVLPGPATSPAGAAEDTAEGEGDAAAPPDASPGAADTAAVSTAATGSGTGSGTGTAQPDVDPDSIPVSDNPRLRPRARPEDLGG